MVKRIGISCTYDIVNLRETELVLYILTGTMLCPLLYYNDHIAV